MLRRVALVRRVTRRKISEDAIPLRFYLYKLYEPGMYSPFRKLQRANYSKQMPLIT
jgi:hypothetical protein